ncbi:hypothetical protein P154DRAFT_559633 [Amniculicola lignicola CBS 123094]|uniref:Uncharacterized protein n=1 Tax=Amniculicola lignicola CBS 123094 TaxID=1392246 RepID=A0A6A5X1T9_9PLEO|nr:hypothetical protein P154DRAFT_559633 [Amniculicola lignicola CBS 123094]
MRTAIHLALYAGLLISLHSSARALTISHTLPLNSQDLTVDDSNLDHLQDLNFSPQNSSANKTHPDPRKRWNDNGPRTSDDDWDRLKCKGSKLLTMMQSDDHEAGQLFDPPMDVAASRWTDFPASFEHWGYSTREEKAFCDMDETDYGVQRALRGLGASTKREDWVCYEVSHGDRTNGAPNLNDQTYKIGDRVYRVTGAYAAIAINKKDGILIFRQRYSPWYASRERNPPVPASDIPDLKQASDLTWGLWQMHASGAKLRYIFAWEIKNDDTRAAVRRAIKTKGANNILKEYPGQLHNMEDESALALLGTPNGVGTAYFLIQHKAALGNARVSKVRIFKAEIENEVPEASLIFRVD